MQFRILGPLEIQTKSNRRICINAQKPRLLLAILLLDANSVVPDELLVDGLWATDPPRSAVANLRTYAGKLRHIVGMAGAAEPQLVTEPDGYRLLIEHHQLDLLQWRALVKSGFDARRRNDLTTTVRHLGAAHRLWRGSPCLGLPVQGVYGARVAGMHERHMEVTEALIDARLLLGEHRALIGELRQLVGEHSLRERLWAQLMVALYRSGRQADALNAYQEVRSHLIDQLGVEPGHELQRLEHAVLNVDPALTDAPMSTWTS